MTRAQEKQKSDFDKRNTTFSNIKVGNLNVTSK